MSRRRLTALVAVTVLLSCATVATGSVGENPLAGRPLYVEPGGTVVNAVHDHPRDAAALSQIARTPQAKWFIGGAGTRDLVNTYVTDATAADATPVLVLYAIPHRDVDGHSAGGVADAAGYRAFVADVRAGIDGRHAVVIIEPDALATVDSLPVAERGERLTLLRETVGDFAADGSTTAYLDAGHSRWLSVPVLVSLLREVGIDRIHGLSLNVSNFFDTLEERAYGEQLATALGVHYVIDTSRNGVGPASDAADNWCNPPGRALGRAPEIITSPTRGHLDAYLWIKRPGESDGPCHPGDPASGLWFHPYALALIANRPTDQPGQK